MGEVVALPLQEAVSSPAVKAPATVTTLDVASCSLCGRPFGAGRRRFRMVTPRTGSNVTVCQTCHNAVLDEGYRPA